MNALRYSERDPRLGRREGAIAWKAHLATEAVAPVDDEYEACYRALEHSISAWVKSGRAASRLLEEDELRVVRHWLTQGSARNLAARPDLEDLLSSSEVALAARVAATQEARRHRHMRHWMIVALVVMTAAAIAVTALG